MFFLNRTLQSAHNFIVLIFRGYPIQQRECVQQDQQPGLSANLHQLTIKNIVLSILVITPCYGLCMGSYAAVAGDRPWLEQLPQMVLSAIKMPILLLVTLAISIPSFFVFNSLAGLREDFRHAMYAIVASLASFSVIVVSLAPFTIFFYYCSSTLASSYRLAVLFNALMFLVATSGAQFVLFKSYRQLKTKNKRHAWMVKVWMVLFAFVGIQAGWSLRPFIGSPNKDISFFRDEPFSNAYLNVFSIARAVVEQTFS